MTTAPAASEQRKGGWGWLLLPALVMLVGMSITVGFVALGREDITATGDEVLALGPAVSSFLQLALLWIAWGRLRAAGVRTRDLIGFNRERLFSDLGLAIVIAAATTAVIQLVMRTVEPAFGGGEASFPTWAIVWWIVVTSATAGVGEEVYFRGFLFERLGRLSVPALLVATSLAFALWHVSPVILLRTFLVGLGFGWVYLRTGRLFPLILGHWLTNVAAGFWMLAVR